jgi:hypothetical protein
VSQLGIGAGLLFFNFASDQLLLSFRVLLNEKESMLRTVIGSVCGCLFLTLSLVGCGEASKGRPKLYPVSGVVKYKGQPVKGAMVTFAAKDAPRGATGMTDDSGAYKLTTFDTNDGAPEGPQTITISKQEVAAATSTMKPEDYAKAMQGKTSFAPPVNAQSTLPAKYADPKTSGLTRTVEKSGANTFNFDLMD